MKFILLALVSAFSCAHATSTADKTELIEARLKELAHRVNVTPTPALSELTPEFIEQDIVGVRRMILDLLTPPLGSDFITQSDKASYLNWATLFNRNFRELIFSKRFRVTPLPFTQKKIVPDLYRMLASRAYPNDFLARQWSNRVTPANFPLALQLLNNEGQDTANMRQYYESLLDRTRKIKMGQLRYLLSHMDKLFSADGKFQGGFLDEVVRMTRSDLSRWNRKCAENLSRKTP